MNWEDNAIATCSGTEVALETLTKGAAVKVFIVPRLFSRDVKDNIGRLQLDYARAMGVKPGKSIPKDLDPEKKEEMKEEFRKQNTENAFAEGDLAKANTIKKDMERAIFLGGVLRHNLTGKDDKLVEWDDVLLAKLREYPAVLDEIIGIINNFNKSILGEGDEEEKKSEKSST